MLYSLLGILIPLVGTSLGSAFVFFLKSKINNKINKLMIGFAIGVMLAASIFSLLIPSIEMSKIKYLSPSIGFACGFIFLIIINTIVNKLENNKKIDMLIFSVTLHNIPEGMAVGVCFAGYLLNSDMITLTACMLLSLGIAIQNIPEGAIISMPLRLKGKSKTKSFIYGVLSGIVEPIFSLITVLLLDLIVPILPYLLSFASGAMMHVVIEELIPEMHEGKSNYGIIGVLIGFIVMMILDITLG